MRPCPICAVLVNMLRRCDELLCSSLLLACNGSVAHNLLEPLHFLTVTTDHLLDPESITSDYETALITAIRDQLPNTTINGCLFHWKQAIRRRMKTLRISDAEAGFAMERGAIDVLTGIPGDQVSTLRLAVHSMAMRRRAGVVPHDQVGFFLAVF